MCIKHALIGQVVHSKHRLRRTPARRFKFAQDFYININGKRNTITLGVDINNLANLINRNWCGIDRLESSQILKYNTKTNAYNFTKPVWSKC